MFCTKIPALPHSVESNRQPAKSKIPPPGESAGFQGWTIKDCGIAQDLLRNHGMPGGRYIPIAMFLFVAAAIGHHLFQSHAGFSPWMSQDALTAYVASENLPKPGIPAGVAPGQKTLNAVQARWKDGTLEFRLRPIVSESPATLVWNINRTEKEFDQELVSLGGEGFQLVQYQKTHWPDGSQRFQAVWQRSSNPAEPN
jgi:hypothetical protein